MSKLLALLLAAAMCSAAVPAANNVTGAIRGNNLDKLHHLVRTRAQANQADGLGVSPLHYAALYGSPEALKLLLRAGANPNAINQGGATPLVYAAWSYERSRLLIGHGATVNVATKHGITPLLVASATHGNIATVRLLLDKGADLAAQTEDGEDALMRAALSGDADMARLLLDRGANPKRCDKAGFTALLNSTTYPDAERIELLLKAGADPNAFNTFAGMVKNGPIALTHMTPLMTAAPYSDQKTISLLLEAGAHVNQTDSRKMTPLMLAIATDHAQPATVRRLLKAGADLQAKDIYGDTALDWALKFGNPAILSILTQAGAPGHPVSAAPAHMVTAPAATPDESIGRTLALFGKSDFFRAGGGCAGCHHQPAYARAYAAVRNTRLVHDSPLRQAFLDAVTANRPRLAGVMPFLSSFGGDMDVPLTLLATNAELGEPASELTDLMIHFLAARQDSSGAWVSLGIARPPIEDSTISRTAYAIEALAKYQWPARKPEFNQRILRAKLWLQQAKPETTYEHADRILGLLTAGVSSASLRSDVDHLISLQKTDGGWAQTRFLQSDAYATGIVLECLFKAGALKPDDEVYRLGVSFLLKTQFADGSWYVRSRAPKFQPYFQSGFPFDHDQWISSLGSAWAVMALSHAAEPSLSARR